LPDLSSGFARHLKQARESLEKMRAEQEQRRQRACA
jgi:hypothetical protein